MANSVYVTANKQPGRYVVLYCIALGEGCSSPVEVQGSWNDKDTALDVFMNIGLKSYDAVYFIDRETLYTRIHQSSDRQAVSHGSAKPVS